MAQQRLQIVIEALDMATKELKDVEKQLDKLEKQGKKSSKSFEQFGMAMLAINQSMMVVQQAIMAVKRVWDFTSEGAQINRLKEASNAMAMSMSADMDTIVMAIQQASLGTVSQMDAMAAASRAMQLGLGADADQLANLMEVAALKGRTMGLSTTQAFNDIVTGVGRMSPLILDNLGIVMDSNATFEEYAEQIGKSAKELSSMEKRQALLSKVLEEGNKQLEDVGGLAEDNAAAFEQMEARVKDASDSLKEMAGEAAAPLVRDLVEIADSITSISGSLQDLSFINLPDWAMQLLGIAGRTVPNPAQAFFILKGAADDFGDSISALSDFLPFIGDELEELAGKRPSISQLEQQFNAMGGMAIPEATNAVRDLGDSFDDIPDFKMVTIELDMGTDPSRQFDTATEGILRAARGEGALQAAASLIPQVDWSGISPEIAASILGEGEALAMITEINFAELAEEERTELKEDILSSTELTEEDVDRIFAAIDEQGSKEVAETFATEFVNMVESKINPAVREQIVDEVQSAIDTWDTWSPAKKVIEIEYVIQGNPHASETGIGHQAGGAHLTEGSFVAGEHGPEVIIPRGGGMFTVLPATRTAALINMLGGHYVAQSAGSGGSSGGSTSYETDRVIDFTTGALGSQYGADSGGGGTSTTTTSTSEVSSTSGQTTGTSVQQVVQEVVAVTAAATGVIEEVKGLAQAVAASSNRQTAQAAEQTGILKELLFSVRQQGTVQDQAEAMQTAIQFADVE